MLAGQFGVALSRLFVLEPAIEVINQVAEGDQTVGVLVRDADIEVPL